VVSLRACQHVHLHHPFWRATILLRRCHFTRSSPSCSFHTLRTDHGYVPQIYRRGGACECVLAWEKENE